jgi:PAS domain S-box-containing protein
MTKHPLPRWYPLWPALFALLLGVVTTFLAAWQFWRAVEAKDRERFQNHIEHAQNTIEDRLGTYIAMLRGGSGLFAASGSVDRARFRAYVGQIWLPKHYAGIQGIGFSRRLRPADKDHVVREMRQQGETHFAIWPDSERPELHTIIFLEPQNRQNRRAIGYNMFTDPVRRAAMERARDRGKPAASGKVTLVQEMEAQKQAGFLVYVPVYQGGGVPATLAQRREKLLGFVYSPFRADDLFAGIFGNEQHPQVDFQVFDGPVPEAQARLTAGRGEVASTYHPRFQTQTAIQVAGQPWTLTFATRPEFEHASGKGLVPVVLLIGLAVSFILAGVSWSQARARLAAERSAAALRQSEEDLREQRERFETTLASIGDAVIATDTAGRITFVNPVAEALTGWSREEATGQDATRVLHLINERTGQEEDSLAGRVLRESLVQGLTDDTLLRRRDGSEIPIDDSGAPIRRGSGAVAGTVLVFRDISERRRARDALRQSAERLRMALEAARMIAWDWNVVTDQIHRSLNAQEFTGLGAGAVDAAGRGFSDLVHPEDRARAEAAVRAALEGRAEYDTEFRILDPDGTVRWVHDRASVIRDAAGCPSRMTGMMWDVTERKGLEEELRRRAAALAEADRRKNEFLAMLAHELRNPLAPIRNALYILQLPGAPATQVERVRAMMERQIQHLVRLVDDLLDVSRIMRGKIDLRKEPLELSAVVTQAVETAQPAIDAQSHQLTVSLPPEPVRLEGDLVRLAQVLANLLNNAAKYTERGGHIWLSADREGSEVVIHVRDNGIGIAPEMLPRIFDLFVQVDRSIQRSQGGLGIGLTLVRRLVEMHGGTIRARSAGPGKGSEFIVRLPALPEAARICQAGAEPNGMGKPAPRRILVVDDNVDSAESLALLLRRGGHEVRTAYDGPTAVQEARNFRPEVAFLDIGMPGMSGFEVAQQLRQEEGLNQALLVAMTGYGQDEDRRHSHEAGFDHHLVKPVDPAAVEKLIASLAPAARAAAPQPKA